MTRLSAPSFWLLAAALLALLVALLALGGPQSQADRALLAAAQVEALVEPARLVTELAAWWLTMLVAVAGAAWLAWRRLYRAALLLVVLLLTQRIIVEQLKLVFDRARPDPAGHLTAVHSMAFPSGHSANAMVLGLGLALLLPLSRKGRRAAVAIGLAFAFVIGSTRLILGVHWPSDVLGGWTLGVLWTLLLVRLLGGTSPSHPH
jgi:undecaprenyl-diphosphatase